MNCQRPKLKQGSCWLLWNHLHTLHPHLTELNVRHYSTRPGIRLPGSASLAGLISHWEAMAHLMELHASQMLGCQQREHDWAWRHQHLQSFLLPLLPGGPQALSHHRLACMQTWPPRRGQVMRIKTSVFAYPQHREGNEHQNDMI